MNTSRLGRQLLKPVRRYHYSTSTPSASSTVPPLPPVTQWRELFAAYSKDRVSLHNPTTAQAITSAVLSKKSPIGGEGKIIIEAFPGPGAISRALLKLPKSQVSKLIILEDSEVYLEHLRPLEADPRVKVVPLSGFEWDTYSTLEERGLLEDITQVPWEDGLHPKLHFFSHLPVSIKGEQLIAQLFRCIPDRSWLYKYGRVPMTLIMNEFIWSRVYAGPESKRRCKLSVIAEATAKLGDAVDPKRLLPYDDNFFPQSAKTTERRPDTRKTGNPLHAVNIIPHADQFITKGMLDKWDYCLRRLFVLRRTPLKRAVTSLAPGAQSLLKTLTDPSLPPSQRVDITKAPSSLTLADWALVLRAFDNWPFAPEDLMISDAFSRHEK